MSTEQTQEPPAIEWRRDPLGFYVGVLQGRKVARIKKVDGGRWGFWYRSATMVLTQSGEPRRTLRAAKAAVSEALTGSA